MYVNLISGLRMCVYVSLMGYLTDNEYVSAQMSSVMKSVCD